MIQDAPGWPKPPDMNKIKRVLIVKLSSIGDVIHALPVSAALKDAYPHIEISWIVEEMAAPMVVGNPCLHEVITLPSGWRSKRFSSSALAPFAKLRRDLHARRFDIAIDLQGLSKSAIVAYASGARYRFGYDWLRELSPLLETRIARRPESLHVIEQFLDVARFLGAPVTNVRFPFHISPDEQAQADILLQQAGIDPMLPFIVVNPSAGGGGNKGWGAKNFAGALDRLALDPGIPVVLVGAPGDREEEQIILQNSKVPPVSLVGKTDLKQLAAVLLRSALHLCGDTGTAHIAAALGTPVVSLFGRSNPVRLAPWGQEKWAIHHRDKCKESCLKFHQNAPINSKQKCLAPPPACLEAITEEEVVSTIRQALAESRLFNEKFTHESPSR